MSRGTVILWTVSTILVAATVVAIVIDPAGNDERPTDDDLETIVEKAATYYDFEHYDRAAEAFQTAAETGMRDGEAWYEYARSVELSSGLNLDLYLSAYQHLLDQGGPSEPLAATEEVLAGYATPFDYSAAVAGEYFPGDIVTVTGTVSAVDWGRVESGRDTVRLDTKPNRWVGNLGDSVLIDMPRSRRYQLGDTVRVIGWYSDDCTESDTTSAAMNVPCIVAAGARLVTR